MCCFCYDGAPVRARNARGGLLKATRGDGAPPVDMFFGRGSHPVIHRYVTLVRVGHAAGCRFLFRLSEEAAAASGCLLDERSIKRLYSSPSIPPFPSAPCTQFGCPPASPV